MKILLNMLSVGKVVVFYRCVAIFGQKYCSFSPKFLGIFFCQNPFFAILRIKKQGLSRLPFRKVLLFPRLMKFRQWFYRFLYSSGCATLNEQPYNLKTMAVTFLTYFLVTCYFVCVIVNKFAYLSDCLFVSLLICQLFRSFSLFV